MSEIRVVRLEGDLDIARAPELRERLLGAVRNEDFGLVLDLTDARYIDSVGVSLLFGGVDDHRVSLISTDPSGSYRGYKATAVGRNSEKAKKVLTEQYRDDISLDEATALAVEAIKEAAGDPVEPGTVNIAVIPADSKRFKSLSADEKKRFL